MKKPYSAYVVTKVKEAVYEHHMIEEGDRIAVGVSGGKDSIALLHLLIRLQRKIPINFDLKAFYVDLGWQVDYKPLEGYCVQNGITFKVVPTQIGRIVFDVRKEKSPCSLCSNLRRGALNEAAIIEGCNKVALGHHLDDIIETFFMSLFYTGQFRTFQPVTYLSRTGLTVIRPLAFITRKTISALVRKENLPTAKNLCPVEGKTKREEARVVVDCLSHVYPKMRENFLVGLKNLNSANLWGEKSGQNP